MNQLPNPGPLERTVLRGGTVVDGSNGDSYAADVLISGGLIIGLGTINPLPADVEIDCRGLLVVPGFVDAHSHADAVIFDEQTQLTLLRQGITTVIGGQDGVSYAPGRGDYAKEYFAAINGAHPTYTGGGIAKLLDSYDQTTPLNFAYLVPAGTVRWEVMGRSKEAPTEEQLGLMQRLVEQGLAEGAVGLSSGLDYVPGMFASTHELAALCGPVATAGSVYVTHMRGGYEANSSEGVEEITTICGISGAKAHISHFHASAPIIASMLTSLTANGVDVTFDAYPYTRGCSVLSMPLLPPELSVQPLDDIMAALDSPTQRERIIREWFPVVADKPSLGPDWATMITLGHIAAPDYAWAHGLTLAEAAARAGLPVEELSLDLMLASRLEVNAIMAVRWDRDMTELATIMASPLHMAGSDGIFIGAHPHPRAAGSFPKYLKSFVREGASWTWQEAIRHLSTACVERFGLGLRGRITPGHVADIVLIDPLKVADRASYEQPSELATGIDNVFVNGIQVLSNGSLTGRHPGQALRRSKTIQ